MSGSRLGVAQVGRAWPLDRPPPGWATAWPGGSRHAGTARAAAADAHRRAPGG